MDKVKVEFLFEDIYLTDVISVDMYKKILSEFGNVMKCLTTLFGQVQEVKITRYWDNGISVTCIDRTATQKV